MAVNAVGSSNGASEAQVHVQARQQKQTKEAASEVVEGIDESPTPDDNPAPRKHLVTA